MVGNLNENTTQELSIEKACEEFNNSVKLTLTLINHQLDNALMKNCNNLEELAVKIAARTNFLEKNPSFLSCLVYNSSSVKNDPLLEFDDIRITLKEHSKRIQEKLDEIESFHTKLFELVKLNGRDQRVVDEVKKMKSLTLDVKSENPPVKNLTQKEEDEFQDCLDKEIHSEVKILDLHSASSSSTNFKDSKDTFDKIKIQKNAYSDLAVAKDPPSPPPLVKFQLFPDIPADVERKKPQEDLNEKLVQQVVATDSLEGFKKLMDRKPTTVRKVTRAKKVELERKYSGSLWFFPQKQLKAKKSKSSVRMTKSAKPGSSAGSTCCNLLVTSSQPCPLSNQMRTKRAKQNLRAKLKCYDLLDDIDCKDIKPIKSEYPRRDIYPLKLQEAKSYLHRMMQENDKVWKKLLQPIEMKRKHSKIEQKKNTVKQKSVKNLIEYLTAPQQKYLSHVPQSLIVMPVKIYYDNFPTRDNDWAILITDLAKPPQKVTDLTKVTKLEIHDLTKIDVKEAVFDKSKKAEVKTKITECDKNVPYPMEKKKEMLDQLRGLKMKNDNIQKNIQKAIDVIESKMIVLLSQPNDSSSTELFCAMEKEISNVLKMMNDNDKSVEAEKDENGPKLKKEKTVVKKMPEAGDQTLESPKKKKEEVKRTEVKKDDVKKKMKKVVKSEEVKKAANIEEGERLLGKVDSVIKKIDNIYTKFYDDTKKKPKDKDVLLFLDDFKQNTEDLSKSHKEKEKPKNEDVLVLKEKEKPANEDVLVLFEDVKKKIEDPPNFVEFRRDESVPQVYFEASMYDQVMVYEEIRLEEKPFEEVEEIKVEVQKTENPPKTIEDKKLHAFTLKAFYTFFFSTVFVALNFDCAS